MEKVVSTAASELDDFDAMHYLPADAVKDILERVYIAGQASKATKLTRDNAIAVTINLLEGVTSEVGSDQWVGQVANVLSNLYDSLK